MPCETVLDKLETEFYWWASFWWPMFVSSPLSVSWLGRRPPTLPPTGRGPGDWVQLCFQLTQEDDSNRSPLGPDLNFFTDTAVLVIEADNLCDPLKTIFSPYSSQNERSGWCIWQSKVMNVGLLWNGGRVQHKTGNRNQRNQRNLFKLVCNVFV